ncbi:MAG: hypothetical protein CTY16_01070 [Methylobacter sp.]|nr:MAG: hypothetical protein CTY16_01070 [Methylobacter sp.]
MKVMAFLKWSALAVILSGCAVYQAEKQKHIALLSAGAIPDKGVSSKEWLRRGNLGIQAANGTGADMGMAALMLLNSGDFQKAAAKQDHLEAWMPLSEARDEQDAKLKMSRIVENAILRTFDAPYQAKVDEYEDEATMGAVSRYRFIRIDGPGCENWSCKAYAPVPSDTASISDGDMLKYDHQVSGKPCPCYVYEGLDGGIGGFVKVTKESVEQGSINGHWHRFESKPTSFGGDEFYAKLSANMPDWVFYYVAKKPPETDMIVPALFNKGKRVN